MKEYTKYILGTILGALIIYLIVYFSVGDPTKFKQVMNDNKQLEQKIDSIYTNQKFLTGRFFELEKSQIVVNEKLDANNNKIDENNKELTKLQKVYNEKIISVDNYSANDLDSFFAKRYPGYYNTSQ